jgi:glucosamine 6-phosphate synthetase-like amidotransferase/phosphosugar isomerase protein
MCGIVGYFGRAANSLTRVLTAMSAIIYRAPDSTGIGIFGDEHEPVRARKTTGSVIQLVDVLLKNPLYPNLPQELMGFFDSMADKSYLEERQLRLIIFENLPTNYFLDLKKGKMTYPLFSDLIDMDNPDPCRIAPGWPGRSNPLPSPVIESREDLQQVVLKLIHDYDLSTVVIKSFIRNALSGTIERRRQEGYLEVEATDILTAFDQVYEEILSEEKVPQAADFELESFWETQKASEYLWRFLRTSRIKIPIDYDTDGVRGIFRLLDGVLMSRLPMRPHLGEALQHQLETLWPQAVEMFPLDWKTLYFAEKGANLYGWAAAAALTFLVKEMSSFSETINTGSKEAQMGYYVVPGKTHPTALSSLLPPIVSQGRWALQSAVTTKNAHPFFDNLFQRIIVLNGQFNTNVEADVRSFLEKVANYSFRSENSSEYFALLWGYYYKRLSEEKKRFKSIRTQIETGLEIYDIGSQSVDYQIFHRLRGKSREQIDELAFIETTRKLTRGGGQIAVSGLSLHSTHKLLVASHNRPVFIVRRVETDDVMVVSDINAAMGLFSQKLISEVTQKLKSISLKHLELLDELCRQNAPKNFRDAEIHRYREEENSLLKNFAVEVYPLDGKELFARISVSIENNKLKRTIYITDFDENPIPDIEPFETILSPPQIQKDFYTSFYETHLNEIPDRLSEILSFYMPDSQDIPRLNIKTGLLQRRFGHNFNGLKRIVMVGMGSANNMNLAARFFIRNILPQMDVVVIRPVEIENLFKVISPEKDLVILSSWSGTTADIVQFANHLKSHNIPFVAVTEKLFSDLGLIAERSGGVLSTLSGEEITVSGIKSTLCMLFCLCLFAVWLCSRISGEKKASESLAQLREIPDILSLLLKDEKVKKFCERISSESAQSCANFVIDALNTTGVGHEAAAKLEECSWSSIAKPLDYNDLYIQCLRKDLEYNLILVITTYKPRLSEAITIMNKLYLEKIPFAAISTSIRELAKVEMFSQNRCICLPSADPALQPFVDFVFFYMLSFHYGRAHGRSSDFPRNRAKSVTAGRNLISEPASTAKEFHQLDFKARGIRLEENVSDEWLSQETIWEATSETYWEKNYFKQMRQLIRLIQEPDAIDCLVHSSMENKIDHIIWYLSNALAEEREIIFLSFDRPANAAAKNLSVQLNRLLSSSFRTASPLDPMESFSDHSLIFLLDSRSHDIASIETFSENLPSGCIYVGPESDISRLNNPQGCCFFKEPFAFCESDLLYITVLLLFTEAIRKMAPSRAEILKKLIKKGCLGMKSIMDNAALKNAINDSIASNSGYLSSFLIGPTGGIGDLWTDRFDQFSRMILQSYYYGESAHGPLVTIDPRVCDKYVRLGPRNIMVPIYGEERVDEWEKRYLNGRSTDVFLSQSPNYLFYQAETPFFADGNWYFPVLRKDYDTIEDNLVILDATSGRYLAQAQDEMSTFGARYARMVVISQEAFFGPDQKISLFKYPISHMLLLPPLFEHNDTMVPIPDLILPIAMSMTSMAMTGATQKLINGRV